MIFSLALPPPSLFTEIDYHSSRSGSCTQKKQFWNSQQSPLSRFLVFTLFESQPEHFFPFQNLKYHQKFCFACYVKGFFPCAFLKLRSEFLFGLLLNEPYNRSGYNLEPQAHILRLLVVFLLNFPINWYVWFTIALNCTLTKNVSYNWSAGFSLSLSRLFLFSLEPRTFNGRVDRNQMEFNSAAHTHTHITCGRKQ